MRNLLGELDDLTLKRWGNDDEYSEYRAEVGVEIAKSLVLAVDAKELINTDLKQDDWTDQEIAKITKILASRVTAMKTSKGVDWFELKYCDWCEKYRPDVRELDGDDLCGSHRAEANREKRLAAKAAEEAAAAAEAQEAERRAAVGRMVRQGA